MGRTFFLKTKGAELFLHQEAVRAYLRSKTRFIGIGSYQDDGLEKNELNWKGFPMVVSPQH